MSLGWRLDANVLADDGSRLIQDLGIGSCRAARTPLAFISSGNWVGWYQACRVVIGKIEKFFLPVGSRPGSGAASEFFRLGDMKLPGARRATPDGMFLGRA
jgi:hypothetical protein